MADIFDEKIVCSKCNKRMKEVSVVKNGFKIRSLECPKCGKHIYHPIDMGEYHKFNKLKKKPFSVKLRMVGHSYVVSIPREIIDFQREVEREISHAHQEMQRHFENMDKFVRLCLEEPGKLTVSFKRMTEKEKDRREE